jgi:signal transduction histidine kinase
MPRLPLPRALRTRLALVGFAAIYVPILLLFVVTSLTAEEDSRSGSGEAVSAATGGPSLWVTVTVVALAPVAAIAAWAWAGRAVRPIDRVRAVAEEISGSDLSRRISLEHGPSEVVALAASFDEMLARLEDAAEIQRRLIEETNHELRTPLTVLRTNADVLLDHPEATLDLFAQGLERSRRVATQLQATIEDLLVDARGRARTIDRRPADVVRVVGEVIDQAHLLATSKGVELSLSAPASVSCALDEPTIRRAIANLVDNAVRHAPPDSTIEVEIRVDAGEVRILVTDHGRGVPADQRERIFERFWHGSGPAHGTGLGLPIAKQIALAHGGDLRVISPSVAGDGCTFELSILRR